MLQLGKTLKVIWDFSVLFLMTACKSTILSTLKIKKHLLLTSKEKVKADWITPYELCQWENLWKNSFWFHGLHQLNCSSLFSLLKLQTKIKITPCGVYLCSLNNEYLIFALNYSHKASSVSAFIVWMTDHL